MKNKTSKIVFQQVIMMGLFYTGIFLIIEGVLFGEVGSFFTAALTFFQSESLMPQLIVGLVFVIVGGIVTGAGLLVAYGLQRKNEFDVDQDIGKLCRPFIALFTAILSLALSLYIVCFVYQYELV